MKTFIYIILYSLIFGSVISIAEASYHFGNFKAQPPIHVLNAPTGRPTGLTPDIIKSAYNLPHVGGSGVIAIIGAYQDPTLEHDLGIFSTQFNLPECTVKNGCLTLHPMSALMGKDEGWSMETSLDVEWAHAIAPNAKILLVEAKTPSGANLLAALDHAVKQPDVVAVSMSWGGAEFPEEINLDSHFISGSGVKNVTFFASAGDSGTGASWPASSPNVVSVGGTRLTFSPSGSMVSEKAWDGSGGGVSAYETEPQYQIAYNIKKAGGMRAIPDVSYNADPISGVSIYYSGKKSKKNGWYVVGGTSAGAPQWAAIKSLGLSADNNKFYSDKSSDPISYFRDIRSGTNGDCGYICTARLHYDYVTGLGSPTTITF